MSIDWDLVSKITVPLVAAAIGAICKDVIERRARLVSFVGHVSSFNVRNPDMNAPAFQVGTHVTVVRNAGRRVANNVSIAHQVLPDYQIFPAVMHEVRQLPGGGNEIFIPRLVPGEEITISYMYQSPLTASNIIGSIKCDEGFTKVLNVMLTPQWPKWVIRTLWCFVLVGFITTAYVFTTLVNTILSHV